jgi:hypothetical protein
MKRKSKKVDKNMDGKLAKHIIVSFVHGPINWPREMGIAKKLIKIAPDRKFWDSIVIKKFPCLSALLTDDGKKFISESYAMFKFTPEKQQEFSLAGIKFGEDTKIDTKPKSVVDFLRR